MRKASLMTLASMSLILCACSEKRAPEPIVVHVFRDPAAVEIDSALLALGAKQLRTSHGRPIIIATLEPKSYADGLEMILGRQAHPDLVILNSSEDGKRAKIDVPPQSAVEVSTKRFYLVITNWASGEEREASELVLPEFRLELQKAGAAVPVGSH
jgi:hypothetical protein